MRRLVCVAAAAAILALGPRAAADVLVFGFEGLVSTLTSDGGLFGHPGTVEIGDSFTGHFSYEVGPGSRIRTPAIRRSASTP